MPRTSADAVAYLVVSNSIAAMVPVHAIASRKREARLFKDFPTADKQQLSQLLHQLSNALDHADWEH
jgi:hypothetical protein